MDRFGVECSVCPANGRRERVGKTGFVIHFADTGCIKTTPDTQTHTRYKNRKRYYNNPQACLRYSPQNKSHTAARAFYTCPSPGPRFYRD